MFLYLDEDISKETSPCFCAWWRGGGFFSITNVYTRLILLWTLPDRNKKVKFARILNFQLITWRCLFSQCLLLLILRKWSWTMWRHFFFLRNATQFISQNCVSETGFFFIGTGMSGPRLADLASVNVAPGSFRYIYFTNCAEPVFFLFIFSLPIGANMKTLTKGKKNE